MKKLQKTYLKSLARTTGLTLGLAILLNQSGAIAKPFSLPNLLSNQYDGDLDAPGDIIIDDNDNSYPGSPTPVNTRSSDTRFTCQMDKGQYTVMYHPESQGKQPYPWAIPSNLGDGWTSERRCAEISRRLEMYRPDGLLELKTGRENNYSTICVTTQSDPSCRIVLTVPPGKNPEITRNQIFQTLVAAEDGQYTQGVNAFTGGGSGNSITNQLGRLLNGGKPQSNNAKNPINLRPFLAPADGGTGAKLRAVPTTPSNSNRLNPNLFR